MTYEVTRLPEHFFATTLLSLSALRSGCNLLSSQRRVITAQTSLRWLSGARSGSLHRLLFRSAHAWSRVQLVTRRKQDFSAEAQTTSALFPNLQDRRIRHTFRRFLACVLLGFCVQGSLIDLPICQPPVAQTVLALPIGRVCAVCCNGTPQLAQYSPQNKF